MLFVPVSYGLVPLVALLLRIFYDLVLSLVFLASRSHDTLHHALTLHLFQGDAIDMQMTIRPTEVTRRARRVAQCSVIYRVRCESRETIHDGGFYCSCGRNAVSIVSTVATDVTSNSKR